MERPKTTHYQFFCNRECEYFPCHKMRTRTISTAFFATAHYTHLAKNAVGSFATFQME